MSRNDFDVVTGSSMPQRPILPQQQRPRPSSETAAEPVMPNPAPIDRRDDAKEKRR